MTTSFLLGIAGMLIVLIHEGSTLKCYQCDSTKDSDCREVFDHKHVDIITVKSTECTVDSAKFCIKTTGVWGGVVGTTRMCSSRDMGNQCQYVTYPDHDRTYRACIYTCQGNSCNAASSLAVGLLWAMLPAGAALLWARGGG